MPRVHVIVLIPMVDGPRMNAFMRDVLQFDGGENTFEGTLEDNITQLETHYWAGFWVTPAELALLQAAAPAGSVHLSTDKTPIQVQKDNGLTRNSVLRKSKGGPGLDIAAGARTR